jgi:hypothetical protein
MLQKRSLFGTLSNGSLKPARFRVPGVREHLQRRDFTILVWKRRDVASPKPRRGLSVSLAGMVRQP